MVGFKVSDVLTFLTIVSLGLLANRSSQPDVQVNSVDASQRHRAECANAALPFEIIPMAGKTMGANVYGFEPAQVFTNEALIYAIQQALEKHLVLVFHNVSHLMTPYDHVRFAKMLGPVDPVISSPPSYLQKGVFNSPDQVKRAVQQGGSLQALGSTMLKIAQEGGFPREVTRIVKEPTDLIAFGEGWHSDLTYRQAPPFAAILLARQLPSKGGNTHFLDMRVAFDTLPEETQANIDTLRANHTDGVDIWSDHPVTRHDNRYGRRSLFVNKAFTRHLIGEAGPTSLEALLQHVEELPARSPEAFLNISWSPNQMLIWDNRFTQHAAQNDYQERREMHRTIVSGTTPF